MEQPNETIRLYLETVIMKSWWRTLLSRILPWGWVMVGKVIKVDVPFVNNEVHLPEFKAHFYFNPAEVTVNSTTDDGSKLMGYTLRAHTTRTNRRESPTRILDESSYRPSAPVTNLSGRNADFDGDALEGYRVEEPAVSSGIATGLDGA